mmetsp:Transcript_23034/g.66122  ORF Transcript_23034/g.66122 Transcript_23034/m.66122 type:complete len:291 (-) Transcript_23034:4065-4937(-)
MSIKVSLVNPAANLSMPKSNCAAFKPCSGIASMNFRAEDAITVPSGPASSLNRSSAETRLARACFAKTPLKAFKASPETSFLVLARAVCCFLHFVSKFPTLTLCFTNCARASLNGPFTAFLTVSINSLIFVSAASVAAETVVKSFSARSIALSGSSWSEPLEATKACAATTAFSHSPSACSTTDEASAKILSAAWRSMASWRFLFSSSIASCCFLFASEIVVLRRLRSWFTFLTFGNIPSRDVLVSLSGPFETAFSSSIFDSKYFCALPPASINSESAWSARFSKAVMGS